MGEAYSVWRSKYDHFNRSSSAKDKIAPAVLLPNEANKHYYVAKYTLPILLENLTPWEKSYEEHAQRFRWGGAHGNCCWGVKLWGLGCSADVDREKYNNCEDTGTDKRCWYGVDRGQKFTVRTISIRHLTPFFLLVLGSRCCQVLSTYFITNFIACFRIFFLQITNVMVISSFINSVDGLTPCFRS